VQYQRGLELASKGDMSIGPSSMFMAEWEGSLAPIRIIGTREAGVRAGSPSITVRASRTRAPTPPTWRCPTTAGAPTRPTCQPFSISTAATTLPTAALNPARSARSTCRSRSPMSRLSTAPYSSSGSADGDGVVRARQLRGGPPALRDGCGRDRSRLEGPVGRGTREFVEALDIRVPVGEFSILQQPAVAFSHCGSSDRPNMRASSRKPGRMPVA
jgi:hypothetical protein